ncbi:MAG: bifunctional adenosylcobinamide kinase/adenosylcobinamide-phosphate guanylyltransferase [Actinobacteria bacterium]|nr:bifunctional adenosylcobinamide kinase/adenosylcobinamide-phosphate guanylyltransferase [Actinomycetota bacterium]
MSKLFFLLGGVRSGKSEYSEKLVSSISEKVAYIATSEIIDDEMKKRIEVHRKRRPKSWETYEILGEDIKIYKLREIFNQIISKKIDVVLIDCITNLLSRIIYKYKLDEVEVIDNKLEKTIEEEVVLFFDSFLEIIKNSNLNVVIVSNEVGLGVVPPYSLGRIFRDLMGIINKKVAGCSDEVYFFVAGLRQRLK